MLFDIQTTVGPLEVYLQNLESLRNLPAFEVEGLKAFEICRFSERCPKKYVFDVCEVCENQKMQKMYQKNTLRILKLIGFNSLFIFESSVAWRPFTRIVPPVDKNT